MKLAHKKWTVATWIFTFACLFNIGNLPAMESVNLSQQVRQNLITLPYYSIFDYLAFELDGSDVTITGQVYRDTLKSDAENALKRIPGIGSIKNDIEVLPLSTSDDRIRLDMYRAIYYHPEFQRYAIQAVPPIHIMVKNGNVTLYGSVSTELDRNLAGLRAKGVPGVFSVTNKLKVSP